MTRKTLTKLVLAPLCLHPVAAACTMAPHFTPAELDKAHQWSNLTDSEVLTRIAKSRERGGVDPPGLSAVQRARAGRTFRRGRKETRGRKKKLTIKHVRKLNTARKDLIKQAKGQREVHWNDIIKKARVPTVDPTTAARAMRAAGIDVSARKPREKPMRKPEHEQLRKEICSKWARRPAAFFTDSIDLIMDNKKWDIPVSSVGKQFDKMRKVRFHLRTRSEGVKPGFTKPNTKKQRVNPGGRVEVCAGIINCKIKLWHYLPKKNWCGGVAESLYRGPVISALKKHVGAKASYLVMEDNDPTGFKSNVAVKAKQELKIRTMDYPKHSPDLMPLDFFVWSEIDRRMALQSPPKNESADQFKTRLKRTALAIPECVIRKAVLSIKKRAQAVVDANGGDIPRD